LRKTLLINGHYSETLLKKIRKYSNFYKVRRFKQRFISFVFYEYYLKITVIEFSETLELSWNIELNRTEFNRIEFFQYFDVFSTTVRSNRIHKNHSNASNTPCKVIQISYIEILKKFGSHKIMSDSVR